MAIDFTLSAELEALRQKIGSFIEDEVRPAEEELHANGDDRREMIRMIVELRGRARFADGADEVHQMTIAKNVIATYEATGSVRGAVGDLSL